MADDTTAPTLTDAEREALDAATADEWGLDDLYEAVERIVADRLAVVHEQAFAAIAYWQGLYGQARDRLAAERARTAEALAEVLDATEWDGLDPLTGGFAEWAGRRRVLARVRERLGSAEPAPCSTCGGTGMVDWAPGQQRDTEDDQQRCPDCAEPAPDADAAALARVRELADEHERLCDPAPYTSERALIERLRAALAGDDR